LKPLQAVFACGIKVGLWLSVLGEAEGGEGEGGESGKGEGKDAAQDRPILCGAVHVSQKTRTLFLAITLANVFRFPKLFHCWNQQ